MNPEEYANLERVEKEHWYYSGKREIVEKWIRRTTRLNTSDLLVDCGAGTGFFLSIFRNECDVLAVDDHAESLEIASRLLGPAQVAHGTANSMPLGNESVTVLTALDVLEHVEDDTAAMQEFNRILKPGGLLILTVPALMLLWSGWDEALHHHRRYNSTALQSLTDGTGFQVIHWNYTNVLALPLVYAVRKFQDRFSRGADRVKRIEDSIPPRWLNSFLKWTFVNAALQDTVRFPAGVSLLMVARKPSR